MAELGVQDGDSDLQMWEHDANKDRVGLAYIVGDFTSAVDAFDALIPAAGNHVHVTLSVQRNGSPVLIHVDTK